MDNTQRRAPSLRFAVLLLWLGTAVSMAAPGDIDTGFGIGGSIPAGGPVLAMPDGRLVVGRRIAGGFEVVAYDPSGRQLDPAFGIAGRTYLSLPANAYFGGPAARGADGRLLFSGERTAIDGSKVRAILRLTASGSPDPTFGVRADGSVDLPDFRNIVGVVGLQDGRTLVLEWRGACLGDGIGGWSCDGALAVWRLLSNGSIDRSFGDNGATVIPESDSAGGWPTIFGVRPDGSILVGDNSNAPTLALLTPAGAIDTSFDATVAKGSEGWWSQGVMLADGGLLLVGVANLGNRTSSPEETWDTQLLKLRPDGRVDTTFGGGSGMVTLDLSAAASTRTDLVEQSPEITLSPDGSQVYLRTIIEPKVWHDEFFCLGVARVNGSGMLDATFGQRGVTCVTRSATYSFVDYRLAMQASGAPLLVLSSTMSPESFPSSIYRLRPDNVPSPGVISMHGMTSVDEDAGMLSIKVARTAGKSGAVSVMYSTEAISASAGDDFVAASGRLDWADGDDTERTINITIRNDALREDTEAFLLRLTSQTGGSLLLGSSLTIHIYDDNDAAVSTPQTPVSAASINNSAGGGGKIEIPALLFLAGLGALAVRRRHLE